MSSTQQDQEHEQAPHFDQDRHTFLKWVKYLKNPDSPVKGRAEFLIANPVCDACRKADTECVLKEDINYVRCRRCVKEKKMRCPRQLQFEMHYISLKMSKPLPFVVDLYEELQVHRKNPGKPKSGKSTKKSQPRRVSSDGTKRLSDIWNCTPDAPEQREATPMRDIIEISDDDDDDIVQSEGPKIEQGIRIKQENSDTIAMQIEEPPAGAGSTGLGEEAINLLVGLNKKFAVLRLHFQNTLRPYQADRRLKDVRQALTKIESIGLDFSRTLGAGDAGISIDVVEDLIGDLAVCRDTLSLTIGILADEPGAEKLRTYRAGPDLEEVVLGFGGVLEGN